MNTQPLYQAWYPAITIGCGPLSSGYQFTIDDLQFIRSALRHGLQAIWRSIIPKNS